MNLLKTDVLIIGAGPTGLALALSLQRAGIAHRIVDRLPEGLNTSRAGVIHAHTLDVLRGLGVSDDLTVRGLKVSKFRVRDGDRVLLQLGFENLPSPHQYLLMLPQDETERILSERLTTMGGTVHRGVTATAVRQSEVGAVVSLEEPSGKTSLHARYVVGADGMRSLVREAIRTPFEGSAFEESFLLADVRMEWPLGNEEVSFFFSPAGIVVVAPLPGDRHRIVATVADAPAVPGLGDIQHLLDSRGPRAKRAVVTEVIWSSRFRIHHRVARSYRQNRLFLAGDAAHVHSPAGGQGMNTGLVDAVVLGEVLERAIRDGDESVLEEYERLRRPAAVQVLGLSGRLTSMPTVRGGLQRWLRDALLCGMNAFPPARRKLVSNLSGLSRAGWATLPARWNRRGMEHRRPQAEPHAPNRGGQMILLVISLLLTSMMQPAAASDGQLIKAGYAAPAPTEVAPGQILTLFFRGISRESDGSMRVASAGAVPLPESLAGVAVAIQQLPNRDFRRIPLLSVMQHNECEEASGLPKCLLTAVRVQIPTELTPVVAKLLVEVDGSASRTFLIRPMRDNAHVVTSCDASSDTNPASVCARLAFHGDGSVVDETRPARPGETIVIYAYGLGPTAPRAMTGSPSPEGAELVESVKRQLRVSFEALVNGSPALPRYFEAGVSGSIGEVSFAGLTPGQVGLYQLNVRVPESSDVLIGCGGEVRSNVIVKVTTSQGTENIALCVEP